jgi:LacI family gluconate utilization system Gnt-I transcriptional repressor
MTLAEIDIAGPAARGPHPRRRRRERRVTLNDVASHSAVSPSTASLYLRRPDMVSPSTGRRIAEAIAALDYVPNYVAGGLAGSSSRMVSIIVPSVRNAFFAETVTALQSALRDEGLQVMLGHTEYSEREEEDLVRAALSWAPAAIVIAGLAHNASTRRLLGAAAVPVIEIWELGAPPVDIAIGFSHEKVGAAAAEHLLSRGRKRLVFIGARIQQDRRAAQRADGFVAAARAGGARADVVTHPAAAGVDVGGILLADAIDRHPDADALACSNDLIALGALFECQRRRIAVPQRLALVGFGDLAFSAACNPSLTTIRPPGGLIGSEAARMIIAHQRGDRTLGGSVVDTRFMLVERQSS